MTHILQFPFRPQSTITRLNDLSVVIPPPLRARLFSRQSYVVLEICGFDSPADATAFIPAVWAALRWVLIDGGINTTFDLASNDIVWAEDPIQAAINRSTSWNVPNVGPVHGIAQTDGAPIVFREGQNIDFVSNAGMSGTTIFPLNLFLPSFSEALCRPGAGALIEDCRFKLATDLYSAFYFAATSESRLVTLGMVLEVIADPAIKHRAALELIDRWKHELQQQKLVYTEDEDATHALESLERELLVRQEASIRGRIRSTARRLSSYLQSTDSEEVERNAVATYDARSTLVHHGQLDRQDISECVAIGQHVVRLLLMAYYRDIVRNGTRDGQTAHRP